MSDSSTRPGKGSGIPRGIEVLVKKASVDFEFRAVLIEKRAAAAAEIDLELSAAEIATLNSVPRTQIEQVIENTTVPDEHRRVFLGKMAAAMLAVIALPLSGCFEGPFVYGGIRPDTLPVPQGIRPDDPLAEKKTPYVPRERRVSYDLKKGTAAFGRVPRGQEHLKVTLADNGTNTISTRVHYECPFDRGLVKIIYLDDRGVQASEVKCRPDQGDASRGEGRVTFSAEGKGTITTMILLGLRNTSEEREKESAAILASFLDPPLFDPGEYMDKENCVICRIVEHRKEWPAVDRT